MIDIAMLLAIGTVNYWIYEHYRTKKRSDSGKLITPDWTPPKPLAPPSRPIRTRKRIMSYQCMDCNWGVRDIEQSLIVKQCPSCHASIMTGERKYRGN